MLTPKSRTDLLWNAVVLGRALVLTAVILAAAPTSAHADGDAVARSKWSVFLDLSASVEEGDMAMLFHRGDHVGNVLIGVADATAYRAGVSYQAWSWISFSTDYSISDIRFGSDFYPLQNVDIGNARLEEAELTIAFNPNGDPFSSRQGWGVYSCTGIVTGLGRIRSEKLLAEGQDSLSIHHLRTKSGVLIGIDVEILLRIANTGLALGFSGRLLAGGPELGFETDAAGPYESGAGRFAPETFGFRVRYRLP